MIAEKTRHRETVEVASHTCANTSEVEYGFVYIDEPIFGRADTNDDGDFADSEEQFYYTTNNLYNVVALLDTSGNIIERYEYTPYGEVTVYTDDGGDSDWFDGDETTGTLSGNYYTFTSRRTDPEAGLMYFRNRYYSAELGRFVTRDRTGYIDGMNLYRPYFVPGTVDPMGLRERERPEHGNPYLPETEDEIRACVKAVEDWWERFQRQWACIPLGRWNCKEKCKCFGEKVECSKYFLCLVVSKTRFSLEKPKFRFERIYRTCPCPCMKERRDPSRYSPKCTRVDVNTCKDDKGKDIPPDMAPDMDPDYDPADDPEQTLEEVEEKCRGYLDKIEEFHESVGDFLYPQ